MAANASKSVFCRRFKEARCAAGLSQRQLGIKVGLDEFVASTRINRYEQGVHEADIATATRLAAVMQVPLPYFYANEDRMARMILAFAQLSSKDQERMLKQIEK